MIKIGTLISNNSLNAASSMPPPQNFGFLILSMKLSTFIIFLLYELLWLFIKHFLNKILLRIFIWQIKKIIKNHLIFILKSLKFTILSFYFLFYLKTLQIKLIKNKQIKILKKIMYDVVVQKWTL